MALLSSPPPHPAVAAASVTGIAEARRLFVNLLIVSVMVVTSEKTIPRHSERRAKFKKRWVCLLRRKMWEGLWLLRIKGRYIFEADSSHHERERVKNVDASNCGVIGCRRFPSPFVWAGLQ